MKHRRLFLNALLLQAIVFLAWLAIHTVYTSSTRSEPENATQNLERTSDTAGDKQVERSQNTEYMSQQGQHTGSLSGDSEKSGSALQESKTPPSQSRIGGQDAVGALNLVTGSDTEKPFPVQTSNTAGNYGQVNSGVAAGGGITQPTKPQKKPKTLVTNPPEIDNDPDKVSSPYMRPYNESVMCKEAKVSRKHRMVLTPETKLIMYWDENDNFPERRGGFPWMCTFPTDGPCEITWDESYRTRADAIVFHASRIFKEKLPFKKLPGQVWVARALESPIHWRDAYRSPAWRGVFNWTFTYRPDSELFSPVGSLMKLPERDNPDYRRIAVKKTRSVAWFVSDCNTDSKREKYVREMKKYIDVDIYGECGNLVCSKDQRGDCFDLLSETYRFYLAFENSLCDHYVTEKFFNKFGSLRKSHHVIPVVRGGTNYRKYFPEGTFIDAADFESPKALASYLNKFGRDVDAFAALIARKDQFGSVACSRSSVWCKLCNMLHDKNIKPKVYTDLGAWWDQEACVEPTDI